LGEEEESNGSDEEEDETWNVGDAQEEYAVDSDAEDEVDDAWLEACDAPIVDAWGRWWHRMSDNENEWWVDQYTEDSSWDEPENVLGTAEYPWRFVVDDEGDEFYVNSAVEWANEAAEEAETEMDEETAECIRDVPGTQWEAPPGWAEHAQLLRQEAITAAWEGRYEWFYTDPDEDGDQFYSHILTGETQWDEPAGWAEHQAYQEEYGEGSGLVDVEVGEGSDENEYEEGEGEGEYGEEAAEAEY
jgi:hypothetical protein